MSDEIGLLRSIIAHRAHLASTMGQIRAMIDRRIDEHDLSKLNDDEFAGFARINRVAREHKFGSPEYAEAMQREKPTLDLHFSRNRHHAERPGLMGLKAEEARGLPDDATYWEARNAANMTWLDIVEMVCDWRAAQLGYGDNGRTWAENVEKNLEFKGKYLTPAQTWLARSVAASLGVDDAR